MLPGQSFVFHSSKQQVLYLTERELRSALLWSGAERSVTPICPQRAECKRGSPAPELSRETFASVNSPCIILTLDSTIMQDFCLFVIHVGCVEFDSQPRW